MYTSYQDSEKDFSIQYPADWTLVDSVSNSNIVLFAADKNNFEGLNVAVFPKSNRTLVEIVDQNVSRARAAEGYENISTGSYTSTNGLRYETLNATVNDYENTFVTNSFFISSDSRFYIISTFSDTIFTQEQSSRNKRIIDSFEIKGRTGNMNK